MFEKKFLDFLLENDIDIDLIIARDEEETKKFENLVAKCELFNIKTLMPYDDMKVKVERGKMTLYFKFTINRRTSLRHKACIDEYKKVMTKSLCEFCELSTFELCAFNSVYKTNGIIIKQGKSTNE